MTAIPCPLHPRQIETVRWLADGKSADEIAEIMGIAYNTAITNIKRSKDDVGAVNSTSLVAMALRNGWIS